MPRHPRDREGTPQGLYDRLAEVQNLAMKINGYRTSVAKYLSSLELDIGPDSFVLDAGCGTGLATLAFQDAGLRYKHLAALDLSMNCLRVARDEFSKRKRRARHIDTVQGNVLSLPFADGSFDLAIMCGVLEYTPLDEGLSETARVLRRGAKLVLLPVKPSIVGSVLELLYNFRIHPLEKVRNAALQHFKIVGNHEFPIMHPIAWSKTIFLLEKA